MTPPLPAKPKRFAAWRLWLWCWALYPLCLVPLAALAHSTSTAYLAVERAQTENRADGASAGGSAWNFDWRIALRDADALLDLDADGNGVLTWGETTDRTADLRALAAQALQLGPDTARCRVTVEAPRYVPSNDAALLGFVVRAECEEAATELAYRLFEGVDPTHRVLVTLPGRNTPHAFAPGDRIALGAGADAPASFAGFFAQGISHIAGGLDHLLFLVTLMLPAVLVRAGASVATRAARQAARRAAMIEVAWIVTAFTLAHSLTLAAATFGWVRIPVGVIEPLIAATVLLAALNNLWPVVVRRVRWVAFAFGLVHGFGFSEVLAPLSLPMAELAQALLAFNLGVEAGQLAVVALAFSLLALAARWSGYRRWVLSTGSIAVAALAAFWLVDRVFELDTLAFGSNLGSRMTALASLAL